MAVGEASLDCCSRRGRKGVKQGHEEGSSRERERERERVEGAKAWGRLGLGLALGLGGGRASDGLASGRRDRAGGSRCSGYRRPPAGLASGASEVPRGREGVSGAPAASSQ